MVQDRKAEFYCLREDLITSPLFTTFEDGRMASTNALDFADAELRAKMLGDAIPAESFAAGRNVLDGFEMAYYLNPTPLDRNLEWDRKNNGFKGECPPYRLP